MRSPTGVPLLASLALLAATIPAAADGFSKPKAAPAYAAHSPCAASKLHGLYAGGHGGLAWLASTFEDIDGYGTGQRTLDRDASGTLLGIQVGYNWARCSMLIGVEWDFSWVTASTGGLAGDRSFHLSNSLDYLSSLRGRVGWVEGSTLLYGTLGIAFAGITTAYTNPVLSAGTEVNSFESDGSRVGVVVGFGADYALNERIVLSGNLLYYGFGTREVQLQHAGNLVHNAGELFAFEDGHSVLVTRFGVSIRIGNGRND